jgi:pimeloyl-ACP methyl ester carboxylesterase
MQTKPSIVFCHGIWADGSCFAKVIPTLQADGYEVMAAQYGLDTPEGDVATVKRTLGRVSSPAILVGHSCGGSVITAAGTDDRVAGLEPMTPNTVRVVTTLDEEHRVTVLTGSLRIELGTERESLLQVLDEDAHFRGDPAACGPNGHDWHCSLKGSQQTKNGTFP